MLAHKYIRTDFTSQAAVEAGRLVRLAVEDFSIDVWRQLLYHKNKWISPAMQAVLELCKQS